LSTIEHDRDRRLLAAKVLELLASHGSHSVEHSSATYSLGEVN
jgi:hypothetical protein